MPTIALLLMHALASQLPGQHANGPPESMIPLVQALVDEDFALVDELLQQQGTIERINEVDVISPLYAAQEYVRSSKRRHALVRRLLRAGALPDRPTQDGSTTLMLAAYHGDVRSAQLLLEAGADPLRKNQQGHHSISAAQQAGHDELAELMREHMGESGVRWTADDVGVKEEL